MWNHSHSITKLNLKVKKKYYNKPHKMQGKTQPSSSDEPPDIWSRGVKLRLSTCLKVRWLSFAHRFCLLNNSLNQASKFTEHPLNTMCSYRPRYGATQQRIRCSFSPGKTCWGNRLQMPAWAHLIYHCFSWEALSDLLPPSLIPDRARAPLCTPLALCPLS